MATSSSTTEHIGHETNGTGTDSGDATTQYKHFLQSCELYTLYSIRWFGTGTTKDCSHDRALYSDIRLQPCVTEIQRNEGSIRGSSMVLYTSRRWCSSAKAIAGNPRKCGDLLALK